MIFNLIIGILAGIGSRYAEAPIAGLIKGKLDIPKEDLRVLAFVVTLLAASILIGLAGVNGMPIVLLIGGGLGVFGKLVMKFSNEQKQLLKAKMEERKAYMNGDEPAAVATPEPVKTETVKPAAKKPAAKKTAAKKPAAKK